MGKSKRPGKEKFTRDQASALIMGVFGRNPRQIYNYKQISKLLFITDKNRRAIVNSTLDELVANKNLEQVGPGRYRMLARAGYRTGTIDMTQHGYGFLISEDSTDDVKIWAYYFGGNDLIEAGVPVDAQISKELLTSIFQPSSPMHDGAVVIQEGRVSSAGCILPLTLRTDLPEGLGTRHRAAVGITAQASDGDGGDSVGSWTRVMVNLSDRPRQGSGMVHRFRFETYIGPADRAQGSRQHPKGVRSLLPPE